MFSCVVSGLPLPVSPPAGEVRKCSGLRYTAPASELVQSATPISTTDVVSATVANATREAVLVKVAEQTSDAIVNKVSEAITSFGGRLTDILGGEHSTLGNTFKESLRDVQDFFIGLYNIIRPYWFIILPFLCILGGWLLGVLFELFILRHLKIYTQRTRWKLDDVIVDQLESIVKWFFILLGLYGMILSLSMRESTFQLLSRTLQVLLIIVLTIYIKRVVVGIFSLYSKETRQILSSSTIFNNIAMLVVYAFGGLIVLKLWTLISLLFSPRWESVVLLSYGVAGYPHQPLRRDSDYRLQTIKAR